MKKQMFTTLVAMATIGIAGSANAQTETAIAKKKGNWDVKTSTTARVTTTPGGCTVVFDYDVKSPRDMASGQASGKRMHKPYVFAVSSTDNAVTEISSPKDQSTGQASGKVSYSDLSVMISMEKASVGKTAAIKLPVQNGAFTLPEDFQDGACDVTLSWSWGASNRCTKTFTVKMQEGSLRSINESGISVKSR